MEGWQFTKRLYFVLSASLLLQMSNQADVEPSFFFLPNPRMQRRTLHPSEKTKYVFAVSYLVHMMPKGLSWAKERLINWKAPTTSKTKNKAMNISYKENEAEQQHTQFGSTDHKGTWNLWKRSFIQPTVKNCDHWTWQRCKTPNGVS